MDRSGQRTDPNPLPDCTWINATAVGNASLQTTKQVRFYNTSPQNIDVSANPQSMPSRDALPAIYGNVSGKVTDVMGNGVSGETVYFTLHDIKDSPLSANETKNASFSSSSKVWTASAVTDANGYATVQLYPAKYALTTEPGYNSQVTGTGTVTATWSGNRRTSHSRGRIIPITQCGGCRESPAGQGGTERYGLVQLNGDGWALVPPPVDCVLITDLSGSMTDNMAPSGTKLSNAQAALKKFVGMSGGKMYIALGSFSNAPSSYSTQAEQLWKIENANNSAKPFNPYGRLQ